MLPLSSFAKELSDFLVLFLEGEKNIAHETYQSVESACSGEKKT